MLGRTFLEVKVAVIVVVGFVHRIIALDAIESIKGVFIVGKRGFIIENAGFKRKHVLFHTRVSV